MAIHKIVGAVTGTSILGIIGMFLPSFFGELWGTDLSVLSISLALVSVSVGLGILLLSLFGRRVLKFATGFFSISLLACLLSYFFIFLRISIYSV